MKETEAAGVRRETIGVWEEDAVCSRADVSELHPLTASGSASEDLTQEERAGTRKQLRAEIYPLCCLHGLEG